jgi:hypothetical protein
MVTRHLQDLGALVVVITLSSVGFMAQAGRDDAQVIEALRTGSPVERRNAVEAIRKIPIVDRGQLLLAALLEELDRQDQRLQERQLALATGRPLPPSEQDAEYLFSLLDVVSQHRDDPTIIRPLLPFITTGNAVINTLASFGNLAVADVLAIATSGVSPDDHVDSALLVLRRMLEKPGNHPLSASWKNAVVKVAKDRLTGTQGPTVVMNASDLAVATGDAELIARVRVIAEDADAVRRLGIQDDLVPSIQRRASAALARLGQR